MLCNSMIFNPSNLRLSLIELNTKPTSLGPQGIQNPCGFLMGTSGESS